MKTEKKKPLLTWTGEAAGYDSNWMENQILAVPILGI